jgi:signal peptidase II
MMRGAFVLALVVLLADQASKYWILERLDLPALGSLPLLPVLSFTYVENVGVSMGLFAAGTPLARWGLTILTAGIAAAVAVWITRERDPLDRLALGLILGGAVGNILDRIRFGHVTDFIHVHWQAWSFWVFNIADAAITIGVILLLVRALLPKGNKLHA